MLEDFLQKIFTAVLFDKTTELEVNLQDQTITILNNTSTLSFGENPFETFEINNYKKTCLMNGYDDIDYLLSMKNEIEQYELQRN